MISSLNYCLFCHKVHEQGDSRDGSECETAEQFPLFDQLSEAEAPPRPRTLEELMLLGG